MVARLDLFAQMPVAATISSWADRMAFLRDGCRRIVGRLQAEGVLAKGLDLETGADLMWALASVPLWDALIEERGWKVERYRTQLRRVMASALLDRPFGPPAR